MKVNSGTVLIGFFAILSGLVGVHLYREANKPQPQAVMAQPEPAKPPAPSRMTVPMVSRNISLGQRITMDDVALVRLTRAELDKLGIGKVFMTNPDQIIGKTVRRELKRGTTFDTRDFFPQGQGPGIAHLLKPGYRAVTIALSPTNALIGFAGAGERVDILFHYRGVGNGSNRGGSQGWTGGRLPSRAVRNRSAFSGAGGGVGSGGYGDPALMGATSTLVQDAEILALNHTTGPTNDPNSLDASRHVMVTLAVTPESAELLRVARGHGDLSLTLRSPEDVEQVPIFNPTTLEKIIKVEKEKINEMQIYRGKSLSTLRFASTGGGVVGRFSGYPEANPRIADPDAGESQQSKQFVPVAQQQNVEEGFSPPSPDREAVQQRRTGTKLISMPKTRIEDGAGSTPWGASSGSGRRNSGSGLRDRDNDQPQ